MMKRHITAFVAAAAMATSVAMFSPASPAAAHTDACAGTGSATLGVALVYPAVDVMARTGSFTFGFTAGTCAIQGGLSAAGLVSGWCGLSSGSGITDSGHRFAWLGIGGELLLTGDVNGVVNAVPNAVAGESCLTGADNFLVQGVAELTHCAVLKEKSQQTNPTTGLTVWTKTCV